MLYLNNAKKYFKLKVLGYEFHNPEMAEDLNWLNIEVFARDGDCEWDSKGPFITTLEIQDLYKWISKLSNKPDKVQRRLDFIENELSFKLNKKRTKLIVNLDFSLHPKKESYDYDKDSEYELKFKIKDINIKHLIESIKQLTEEYPIRLTNNFLS